MENEQHSTKSSMCLGHGGFSRNCQQLQRVEQHALAPEYSDACARYRNRNAQFGIGRDGDERQLNAGEEHHVA